MTELWHTVVFLQDGEYDEIADMGVDEMFEYLSQWDTGEYHDDPLGQPWGTHDNTYRINQRYMLSVNRAIGYAGLQVNHSI